MGRRHVEHSGSALAPPPSWGRRLVGIEGLRGIAALSVVVGHVQIHAASGVRLGLVGRVIGAADGLTLFFALSGFLLFRPFASAILTGRPRPATGRFFRNRALRVFPGYVVIFLLASYVLETTYKTAASGDGGFAGARATLGPVTEWWKVLLNLGMLQTLVPGANKTGIGPAWSLTVELCFYVVLPALAWAAWMLARRMRRRVLAMWLVPLALVATGLLGRAVAAATLTGATSAERYRQIWGDSWHAVLERSIFANADLFGYGAAAAGLFVLVESGRLSSRATTAVRWTSLAAVVLVGVVLVDRGSIGGSHWNTVPVGIACGGLILATSLPTRQRRSSLLGRCCDIRVLNYSGLISYSVYLWHIPVLWWLAGRNLLFPATRAGFAGNVALVVAVTFVLSSLTYYLVEAPAMRLKRRTDVASKPVASTPATAVTVAPTPEQDAAPAGEDTSVVR